jgi:Flp pilus assembly pilin Flp
VRDWRAILKHAEAATTAEYAIILALGAAVTVGGLLVLRSTIADSIASSGSRLAKAAQGQQTGGSAIVNASAGSSAGARE